MNSGPKKKAMKTAIVADFLQQDVRILNAVSSSGGIVIAALRLSYNPKERCGEEKLKACARLGADPWDFNLNFFINLPRSCAMSFDATEWRYKTSHHFHGL